MKAILNKKRLEKLKDILINKSHILSPLLFIAGVVGIFLFADMRVNRNTFVSENALLPGYVVTKYKNEQTALNLLREFVALTTDESRKQWIRDSFRDYGLEVYNHNFTVDRPIFREHLEGDNIYAVYRAPKISSTEALVFSTSYHDAQYAIPLMLSIVELVSRQTIWAKDIIFLVAEHGEYGVGAWLQSYHDSYLSSYIKSDPLLTHSGAIQAALHLDMPEYQFDRLRMYVDAINGQLPDIDLVVLVRIICRQEGIQLLLQNDPHDIGDFTGNLLGLHANMAWQAAGRVSFPSALYHPYNIHAIGVKTERKYRRQYKYSHMGRFTESVLRSVNNLEEQFHTAYYFYLMPCVERFVCLSVYMIPCGLIVGAVAVRTLSLWLQAGTHIQTSNIFISNRDINVIDCIYPFLLGVGVAVLNEVISLSFSHHNLLYLIGLSQICVLAIGGFTTIREDWKLNQAFALLVHVLAMVMLCMLNISLTIFYAIPSTFAFLIQFPYNKPARVLQRVILLLANPAILVLLYSYLYTFLHLDNNTEGFVGRLHTSISETVESTYTFNVWTWKAYSCLLFPVWALQWTLKVPVNRDNSPSGDKDVKAE